MKAYFQLTKLGIGLFVMITGLAGYAVAHPMGHDFDPLIIFLLVAGLYLLSSGSFAINQAQEVSRDKAMKRTEKRPLVTGVLQVWQAYVIGVLFLIFGLFFLVLINPLSAWLGVATVVLYNGLYTLLWKRRWIFGAVPGAVPGAMPVVIGYAAGSGSVLSIECLYLFLIMFLWQMPHFWSLAIRYKDDYLRGGFPVMPAKLGTERALYHIGLYTFAYVGLAMGAPWFLQTHVLHALLVIPLALKVLWEFSKYFAAKGEKNWLPFFLWTNLSMLVFVCAPVFDRWIMYWAG